MGKVTGRQEGVPQNIKQATPQSPFPLMELKHLGMVTSILLNPLLGGVVFGPVSEHSLLKTDAGGDHLFNR